MQPKTIWVMGARGFVGSHVARAAAASGYRVLGLGHGAWLPDDAAAWGVEHWRNGEVDEINLDLLATESGLPDGIFHCAGGSSVGVSLQAPYEDYSRSVTSTARLLEWQRRRAPHCRFVLASSAAVYGSGHVGAIVEQATGIPASPYGTHKLAAEVLVRGAQRSFGLKVGIIRPFSLYGETLRKQLIWDICTKLNRDASSLALGGTGEELRDFIHVVDAAAFFVKVFEQLEDFVQGGFITVNCGTGAAQSIRQIAESVIGAWGQVTRLRFDHQGRAGDPAHLVADVGYARELGLLPRIAFADGVARTVEWFRREHPAP
ncbi:MAG: NAD(P)-dependent oxidoreductase [Pseudomonadota bacterium]